MDARYIYLDTVSTSCSEFESARHRDRARRFSKVVKTKASRRNPGKELQYIVIIPVE